MFKRPAAAAALFSKAGVPTLDITLLRIIGTGFISAAAAYLVEGVRLWSEGCQSSKA